MNSFSKWKTSLKFLKKTLHKKIPIEKFRLFFLLNLYFIL